MPRMKRPADENHRRRIEKALQALLAVYPPSPDGQGILLEQPVAQHIYLLALKLQMQELFPKDAEPQALHHLEKAAIAMAHRPPHEHTLDNLLTALDVSLDHEGFTPVDVLAFLNLRPNEAPANIHSGDALEAMLMRGELLSASATGCQLRYIVPFFGQEPDFAEHSCAFRILPLWTISVSPSDA